MAPAGPGVGHLHTMHDYWLLCACTNLRHATTRRAAGPVRRHPLAASPSARTSPPDEITSLSAGGVRRARRPGYRGLPPIGDQAAGGALTGAPPERPDRPVVFGFIGQVNPNKGIKTLVEAFTKAAIPGSTLRVAGRGRLQELDRA